MKRTVIILGVFDVVMGILFLPFLIFLQGISPLFILGFYYIYGGVLCLRGRQWSRLMWGGIIFFSMWSIVMFIGMTISERFPEYYRLDLAPMVVLVSIVLLPVIINGISQVKAKNKCI